MKLKTSANRLPSLEGCLVLFQDLLSSSSQLCQDCDLYRFTQLCLCMRLTDFIPARPSAKAHRPTSSTCPVLRTASSSFIPIRQRNREPLPSHTTMASREETIPFEETCIMCPKRGKRCAGCMDALYCSRGMSCPARILIPDLPLTLNRVPET